MNLWFRLKFFWMDCWDWIESRGNRLFCKWFGHPTPYVKRMSCETCPRCLVVMKHTGQMKIYLKMKEGPRSGDKPTEKELF